MITSGMAPPRCSRRSACSTAASSAAACSATAISNSSAFSTPSNAKSRPASRSMSFSTTTPPISTPKACPREGGGAGLAGAPSALDLPLHSDLGLLAQCRRKLLFQDDAPAHPPRRLPLDRRSAGRHQRLSRRAQCQPKTLRLDPIRQCYYRKNSNVALCLLSDSVH